MQLTMNIYEMSSSELELMEALVTSLIRSRKELVLGYPDTTAVPVVVSNESNQPTLPFDGEIDTTLPPKKVSLEKKPRAKRTKTASETTNTPEEVTEPTKEVNTSSVTLQELKELAQRRVASTDRESVKSLISKYGAKLTEVPESKYLDLYDELANLKD